MPMVYNISTNLILWRQTMLTNNKNFVRTLAMLLAMLMVMAVALTGCGNKTADEALAKAEEAKTVADEVKAALAGYLTTADAEAKVAALVDAALSDGSVDKAVIDALATQLADYVKADDVAGLIKDAVAEAALEGAMTKDAVLEILKDYYTKDEVDAKIESYFGEFEPKQVLAMLDAADKAMNKKDWKAATDVVLETIEDMQELLDTLTSETYTQANMAAVNKALEPVGLVAFEYNKTTEKLELADTLDNSDEFAKMLEYAILRTADLEDVNALKAAVAEAVAVPTYESAFEALVADLYALGELVEVGTGYNEDGEFLPLTFKDCYGAPYKTITYHGVEYKATDKLVAQVVTLDDKAAYYDFLLGVDALLTEYALDDASFMGGTYTAKYVYRTVTNGVGTVALVDPANAKTATGTKVGETVVAGNDAASDLYRKQVFNGELKDSDLLYSPLFEDATASLVGVVNDYKATGLYVDANDVLKIQLDYEKNSVAADEEFINDFADAYVAVTNRLNLLQTKANTLNTTFTSFLQNTIQANSALVSKDYKVITDAEFLAALTAAMCEYNNVNSYALYLNNITALVENFRILNAKSNTGFVKVALYEDMISKAYDLLWDKYLAKAFDDAETILNDYLSILYIAPTHKGATTEITKTYTAADAAALMTGESVTAADLTDGFLNAFLNGDKSAAGVEYLDGTIYDKAGHSFNKINVNWILKGNDALKVITGSTGAPHFKFIANSSTGVEAGWNTDKTAVPFAAMTGEQKVLIASRLAGAMTYTSTQIIAANKDAMKASGVPVQEAFNDILAQAMANMDEIYMRVMLPAYKAATLNYLYAYATTVSDFYTTGTGTNATVIKALEQYLTGYAFTKTNDAHTWADQLGATVTWNKNSNGANTNIKSVAYTENGTIKSYTGASLKNGSVLTALDAITASLYATSDISGTAAVGAEAYAKADKIFAEAIDVMENFAVANQFFFYIQDARLAWAEVNSKYFAAVDKTNYELLVALSLQNTTVTDTLNNIEFYARHGKYALTEYKAQYLEILEIIVDKNNTHLGLLSNSIVEILNTPSAAAEDKAEKYLEMLADVKSAWGIPAEENNGWVTDKAAKTPLCACTTPNHTAQTPCEYAFVGSSVAEIDEIVNAEAAYWNKDMQIVKLY